jgi:hypothetical protein
MIGGGFRKSSINSGSAGQNTTDHITSPLSSDPNAELCRERRALLSRHAALLLDPVRMVDTMHDAKLFGPPGVFLAWQSTAGNDERVIFSEARGRGSFIILLVAAVIAPESCRRNSDVN